MIPDQDLPSDSELVRRAIDALRCHRPPRKRGRGPNPPAPLWSRVGFLFGHGSGYSSAICRRHGFDPDEIYRP